MLVVLLCCQMFASITAVLYLMCQVQGYLKVKVMICHGKEHV